jgi:hypothetical protein
VCEVPDGLGVGGVDVAVNADGSVSDPQTFTVTDPTVLNVDDGNASGQENGTIERPFRTIAQAVAAATTGDVVKIARGRYGGPVTIDGLTIGLLGGYVGGSDYPTSAGDFSGASRDPAANIVTVDAQGAHVCVTCTNADGSLDGVTLANGSPTALDVTGQGPLLNDVRIEQ